MVVTNRELLREYKMLKEKLMSGEVDEIRIPQSNGEVLKVFVVKEAKNETPFQRMVRRIKKKSYPNLKRPEEDLFDDDVFNR